MIFDLLTQKEKEMCQIINLKKDEIIFYEGDTCHEVGIVLLGVIAISSYSYQGIEMVYNTILPPHLFGNNLIFSSDPLYKGNVISKTNSKIVLIKKEILISLLQNNESFLLEYLKEQSNFGKTLNNKIKILSFYHARDRFLYYLSSHDNHIKYLSITSLASELALSREALSRLISELIKENIITKKKNEIYLNS